MHDETLRIHKLDMTTTKRFHKGMEWFEQGFTCPVTNGWGDESPERMGWLAAQEMDAVKKRWLAHCKEQFIK